MICRNVVWTVKRSVQSKYTTSKIILTKSLLTFDRLFKVLHKPGKRIKMSEEWCIEQFAKLQIKEQRLDTLNEIRTQLSTVGPNEVSISAKFLALLDSIDDYDDR